MRNEVRVLAYIVGNLGPSLDSLFLVYIRRILSSYHDFFIYKMMFLVLEPMMFQLRDNLTIVSRLPLSSMKVENYNNTFGWVFANQFSLKMCIILINLIFYFLFFKFADEKLLYLIQVRKHWTTLILPICSIINTKKGQWTPIDLSIKLYSPSPLDIKTLKSQQFTCIKWVHVINTYNIVHC
jgi:hypothetical protein